MKKNIHINTTLSNQDMDSKTRCGQIVLLFASSFAKNGLTDRQVMQALDYKDMNCIRPRITELIKKGFLEERGSIRDFDTNRMVRLTRSAENQLKLF